MVRSSFPKHCNSFAATGSAWSTYHREPHGITATSNRSTTDYARSASTATTGTPRSRPEWSSATSSTTTATATGTLHWAPPSTLRPAGAPTPRWPARSTESGTYQPDSKTTLEPGGLSNGDSPVGIVIRQSLEPEFGHPC